MANHRKRGPDVFFRVRDDARPFGDRTHTYRPHGIHSLIPRDQHPLYRRPDPPTHGKEAA